MFESCYALVSCSLNCVRPLPIPTSLVPLAHFIPFTLRHIIIQITHHYSGSHSSHPFAIPPLTHYLLVPVFILIFHSLLPFSQKTDVRFSPLYCTYFATPLLLLQQR